MENLSADEVGSGHALEKTFVLMKVEAVNYWLCQFIPEARTMSGKKYNSDSVYQLCCGLQWSVKNTDRVGNLFEDSAFAEFHGVLGDKLKQLNSRAEQ